MSFLNKLVKSGTKGEGVPKRIRKGFRERIKELFVSGKKHSLGFDGSALEGIHQPRPSWDSGATTIERSHQSKRSSDSDDFDLEVRHQSRWEKFKNFFVSRKPESTIPFERFKQLCPPSEEREKFMPKNEYAREWIQLVREGHYFGNYYFKFPESEKFIRSIAKEAWLGEQVYYKRFYQAYVDHIEFKSFSTIKKLKTRTIRWCKQKWQKVANKFDKHEIDSNGEIILNDDDHFYMYIHEAGFYCKVFEADYEMFLNDVVRPEKARAKAMARYKTKKRSKVSQIHNKLCHFRIYLEDHPEYVTTVMHRGGFIDPNFKGKPPATDNIRYPYWSYLVKCRRVRESPAYHKY